MTRHTVSRDTNRNHTATESVRQGFIDSALVAFQSQVISGCQAGRTSADYTDCLVLFRFGLHGGLQLVQPFIIGSRTLQHHDVDRIIYILAPTGGFTRMWADPAANGRQRHALTDGSKRITELVIFNGLDIAGDIDV